MCQLRAKYSKAQRLNFLTGSRNVFERIVFKVFHKFISKILAFSYGYEDHPRHQGLVPRSQSTGTFTCLFQFTILTSNFISFSSQHFAPCTGVLRVNKHRQGRANFTKRRQYLTNQRLRAFRELMQFKLHTQLRRSFHSIQHMNNHQVKAILFQVHRDSNKLITWVLSVRHFPKYRVSSTFNRLYQTKFRIQTTSILIPLFNQDRFHPTTQTIQERRRATRLTFISFPTFRREACRFKGRVTHLARRGNISSRRALTFRFR